MNFNIFMGIVCVIGSFVGVIFLKDLVAGLGMFFLALGYFLGEPKMFRSKEEQQEELSNNRRTAANLFSIAGVILILGNLIIQFAK